MIRSRTLSRISTAGAGVWLAGVSGTPHLAAQAVETLSEMRVLAERQTPGETPLAAWDLEQIRAAAPRTIDELLAREPSFSLYRRQSSLFGNPTSAGVSLRNTAATAASRTLVLLDGIPQNDPFGGWVYWARHDPAALDSITIAPAARSAVWGNQSPAGVVRMTGRAPFENRSSLGIGAGSQGTLGGSLSHQATNAEQTRSVSFSTFGLHSDGFYAVAPSQRGTIDRKLDLDLWGADLKGAWLAAPGLTVEPAVSYYTEERGNGTPLTGNSTDALDLSLRVTSDDGNSSWQALAWHQRREFESVFSSVNADRSAETLALDQFDVPGRGTGGAFTWHWDGGGKWSATAGADLRALTGETHEDVGTFRRRVAGGDQALLGVFGAAGWQIDDATRADASLRLDAWQLTDARRIETSLTSGAALKTEFTEDRDGLEPSAAVELTRDLRHGLEARVSAGSTFRLPTLNELHRPYRVRNDIVEANPQLDPERFLSLEAGLDWQAAENFTLGATAFHHWVTDAIANVPLTDPADLAALSLTVPDGGSVSQRRNVDQARVTGIEADAEWLPREALTLTLKGLWSHTGFSESADQPLLEGKPFPQSPDLRLTASADWRATDALTLSAGCEYGSAQYDDALASREISAYTSVRIGAAWRVAGGLYQIRIDNLFDEEIETGLSSDGIRTLAAPRALWLAATWEF